MWRGVGIEYFAGVFDWLKEGSSLKLFGGHKGISTRLTMLVALLGGSLAAGTGTHINIDVVIRLIPEGWRRPTAIAGALATSMVCLLTSWGFMDHIAITGFGAPVDAPVSAKFGKVASKMGEDFWIWRKQIVFDIKAVPWVVQGKRWNDPERFNGQEWNDWIDDSGMAERWDPEKVATLRASGTALTEPRTPYVVTPSGDPRGILQHVMDLLWPIGFLALGLRFILRSLLLYARQIGVHIEGESSGDEDDEEDEATQAAGGAA